MAYAVLFKQSTQRLTTATNSRLTPSPEAVENPVTAGTGEPLGV